MCFIQSCPISCKKGQYGQKINNMLHHPFQIPWCAWASLTISSNIVLFFFNFIQFLFPLLPRSRTPFRCFSVYASLISFELQELLDLKQRQQRGPQLVQQIRKQANDVSIQICWFTFVLFFYVASCIWYIAQHTKTLPLPSLHMTGP